jgi:hypothetical protein
MTSAMINVITAILFATAFREFEVTKRSLRTSLSKTFLSFIPLLASRQGRDLLPDLNGDIRSYTHFPLFWLSRKTKPHFPFFSLHPQKSALERALV